MSWKHPTGQSPKSVLVVALGPTKADLLEMTTAHQPPASVMDCDEVWGMNGGVNHFAGRVQYDVLWVMDYLDGEQAREPEYARRISAWQARNGSPVITSQAGQWQWKPSTPIYEYPIDEVVRCVGPDNAYFHNSIPYILAYAYFIGVSRLVLFGADYSHEAIKRREEDRANAEYWVGWCRAKNMNIQLPETTTLCNVSRGPWFYGYREQPYRVLKGGGDA